MITKFTLQKKGAIALALLSYFCVVFCHDAITVWATAQFHKIGRDAYNAYAQHFFTAMLVGVFLLFIGWALHSRRFRVGFPLLFAHLLLIGISYRYLVTFNIEFVHFFAYMWIAMLLLPALRHPGEVLILVTLLGAADELYQYLVLNPTFEYYDFNDVLLNLVGAGTGLCAALLLTPKGTAWVKKVSWQRSPFVWSALALPILFFLLLPTPWVAIGPVDEANPALFALYRKIQDPAFWKEVYPGRVIHVVKPWEGVVWCACFFAAFFKLNNRWMYRAGMEDKNSGGTEKG